jgi:creatinine amidohydrolase
MTGETGVWLENLTWSEAKARFDAGAVVVVPIGAMAKEHGHHLPLNTDYLYARELATRVAAALPVVIAPILTHGYYPAFVRYAGSQHLRSETFAALLRDVLGKFVRDGVKRLAVINTGVSTESPLRTAVRDIYDETGVAVHTADVRTLGRKSKAMLQQKLGGHGDESETSIILAIAPEAVRMDRARVDYGHTLETPASVFYTPTIFDGDPAGGLDYSATGVRGDPTLATAEKGRAILADMGEELVQGLRAIFPDAFPRG